ncbi:hypothetical protein [Megamonas hypermegale]|uniref:hypothetical protein n=1 Tax=Megamonas hypermegale TaxID=158847 RepID=UPI00320A9DE0
MGKADADFIKGYIKEREKQNKILVDTRKRAIKRYFYLLDKYIKMLGTAKYSIILGHLVCVGEIIGYSHKKIKADINKVLKGTGDKK